MRIIAREAVSGWLPTFSEFNQMAVLRPKLPFDGAVFEFLSEQPEHLCTAPNTGLSVETSAHSVILTAES